MLEFSSESDIFGFQLWNWDWVCLLAIGFFYSCSPFRTLFLPCTKLKADWPHPRYYHYMPADYRHRQTHWWLFIPFCCSRQSQAPKLFKTGELWQTDQQTNAWTLPSALSPCFVQATQWINTMISRYMLCLIFTPHVCDVSGVIVLTSSVCVSVCYHSHG